jgi:probable F420-dependent oxidoreductase
MKYVFPMPHTTEIKHIIQPWEKAVAGPDQARLAKRAEEMGYDMIRVPEHLVIPREHVELSGAHYFHATVAQGFFAGATERIRIGTGITLIALQHPITMAKGLATADWLSGGRIEVAFGVGWLESEFEALGVDFHKRGRLADEYLAAMIALWTMDVASFEGEFVSFRDVVLEPKPVQKPHLPIWMGGDSDGALRRTARYAIGWNPFLTQPQDYPARLDFIQSQPDYRGGPFELMHNASGEKIGEGHVARGGDSSSGGRDLQSLVDRVAYLKGQGVTVFSYALPAVRDIDAYLDYAQWFIEEVKPRVG